jgi:hypothetical protein
VKNANSIAVETASKTRRDLRDRLEPFLSAGILSDVPNQWQITQGNWEMAPYVVMPDIDDGERYAGAIMGHPLLRTPLILSYIGWDHFKVGSGLSASANAIIKHLCIVHHQIMPDYDLQLLQTHKDGLEKLETYLEELDASKPKFSRRMHRSIIDAVLPNAKEYRNNYLGKYGWIARAKKMDYTTREMIPEYLREDFFSLISFLKYCLTLPKDCPTTKKPGMLFQRAKVRFRD